MTTAIVVGATGIVGRAIVEHLLKEESISTIFCLSRKSSGLVHAKIKHAFLDLRASGAEMAAGLSGIRAEYVYFSAYTAPSDPDEMFKVNNAMLENFLAALEQTGAISSVKRFILTCGLKQYGVHLGQPKQPMVETDLPLTTGVGGIDWPANFYYTQQSLLETMAAKHGFEWVCTLPKDVIGHAKGNFMNQATALGLYCAVSQALPGSKLPSPGNRNNFFSFNTWTSANLHARFCLWAAAAPGAGNQIFNVVNGDVESWQSLWPRLAKRFNCNIPDAPFTTASRGEEASRYELKTPQPIFAYAGQLGIGSDPAVAKHATIDLPIDLSKWSQRPDVVKAWEALRDEHHLDQGAWENATWGFMAMAFGREYSTVASMSKARKLGWTGYENTWDAFEETFEVLEREHILPPS
ncbi:hypothetical protein CDV31_015066 [Fusarium ambrosium]|uniref:Uncharacterized protein n=1 Tax=Fusarium ambrosium TaxID=131363 RepID=A0A428SS86_9HYPO|nr:hypothetical protein CDV31_015066 [Fusarium ambrosium]